MKFFDDLRRYAARLLSLWRRRREPRPAAPTIEPGYRLISGSPATGKSSMLEAEARAAMEVRGLRVMVITSTERMARRLTSHKAYIPGRHFVGSARALCCRLIYPGRLSTAEELTAEALDSLDSGRPALAPAAMVLIDDAQNLSPTMLRIIDRLTDPLLHSTSYYIDPAHGLFAFAGAGPETLSLIRARVGRRVIRLTRPRRPIAPGRTVITVSDAEAAVAEAAERAAAMVAPGITVALLTRTNAEARAAAIALSMRGVAHLLLTARLIAADAPEPPEGVEPWRHYALRQSDLRELLPGGVTIATVHTARDREASHVVILDTLSPGADSLSRADDGRRISLAASRATVSVSVISLSAP